MTQRHKISIYSTHDATLRLKFVLLVDICMLSEQISLWNVTVTIIFVLLLNPGHLFDRQKAALGRTVEKDAVLEGNANMRKATKRRGVRRGRQVPYTRTYMTKGWLCKKPTTSNKTRISLNFFYSAREIQIW